MIMAFDRQAMISYSCLIVTIALYVFVIDDVNFSRSMPFRLLPVVIRPRTLTGGFDFQHGFPLLRLLMFYSN